MKTFTLDEAQALLPVLEALLKRAMEGKKRAESVEADLNALARRIYLSGGMRVDTVIVTHRRTELDGYLTRLRETLSEIEMIGVQVKDLDSGLLDIPCRLEDQVVLLCWRMGESSIDFWHTTESGFKDRKPIDERFRHRPTDNRPN